MKNLSFFGGLKFKPGVADPDGIVTDPDPALEKTPGTGGVLVKFT